MASYTGQAHMAGVSTIFIFVKDPQVFNPVHIILHTNMGEHVLAF